MNQVSETLALLGEIPNDIEGLILCLKDIGVKFHNVSSDLTESHKFLFFISHILQIVEYTITIDCRLKSKHKFTSIDKYNCTMTEVTNSSKQNFSQQRWKIIIVIVWTCIYRPTY
jgi:hypothetical protein